MSNPLLKLNKISLKSLCFGCDDCKEDPIEVFTDRNSLFDVVWIRNNYWGVYFDNSNYKPYNSNCSRKTYIIPPDKKIIFSYEELIKTITDRGIKNWFR